MTMGRSDVEKRKREVSEKAYSYERQYHCCSQATLLALQEALGLEDELTLKASSSLCGGVALSGNTCGALSAGVMVIGMKMGRGDLKEGFASVMKAMLPANRLVRWFEAEYGTTLCRNISGLELNDEMLGMMMANPDAALSALDPEMVEKCSRICGKLAEKVIEILSQEA
jgi:C_GCAxxG_C_C family probable redox protein